MRGLILSVLLCGLPHVAIASEESAIEAEIAVEVAPETAIDTEPKIRVRPFLGLGGALLFESANDRRYQTSVAPPLLALGARFGSAAFWSAKLEYASAETRDGNATISLYKKRESWLLWLSRDLGGAQGWVPYVALAAGASRRDVETRVEDEIEKVSGGWLGTAASAAGVRANWSQSVTAKLEFRYELGDAQRFSEKTSDARLGVAAIIETMF